MPEGLARLDGQLLVPIERDQPENRANDAKVDGRGRLWVGSMAYDRRPRGGALHRVERGVATRVVDGLTISNGPAFDEAGGRLYLADTALGIVDVFELDVDAGRIHDRRRFLDVRDAGWWPDASCTGTPATASSTAWSRSR
jgi:sugar lactone lactonase YvrE